MKAHILKTFLLVTFCSILSNYVKAQDDSENCKDHTIFNRMPNYYISNCEEVEFGMMNFPIGKPDPKLDNLLNSEVVEGKIMVFNYLLKDNQKQASGLQIFRNFQNASKQNGGVIMGEYQGWCNSYYKTSGESISGGHIPFGNGCTNWGSTIKFTKDGKEIWVYVQVTGEGEGYDMVIAEKESMKQDIQANEMFEKINAGESLTLYINFETGKSAIKSESQTIIDELYKMLSSNPTLKISIEGHTDNVGNPASNKTLSEQRASSVKTALTKKGIDLNRIKTIGFGQEKPIAENSNEDGKAKNRRVEIKKQ